MENSASKGIGGAILIVVIFAVVVGLSIFLIDKCNPIEQKSSSVTGTLVKLEFYRAPPFHLDRTNEVNETSYKLRFADDRVFFFNYTNKTFTFNGLTMNKKVTVKFHSLKEVLVLDAITLVE